jgi:hypothetical protein
MFDSRGFWKRPLNRKVLKAILRLSFGWQGRRKEHKVKTL